MYVPQAVQCRGAGGEAPGEINFGAPPSPEGKGVGGISFPFGEGGHKSKLKAGVAGDKEGKPPAGYLFGSVCKCRRRFSAGVPGAKPLA